MYPVEREGLAEFAVGQEELLFIEEKEPLVENQAKAILYGRPDTPRIVGKVDEDGVFMIPSDEQLEPVQIAIVIAERQHRLGVANAALTARAHRPVRQMETVAALKPADPARSPYLCSVCRSEARRVGEGCGGAAGSRRAPMKAKKK